MTTPITLNPMFLKTVYGTRFHHMITKSGRLIATLATEPVPDSEIGLHAVAAAVVAKGDAPSRARGRQIAYGRLSVGKCEHMLVDTLKAQITDRSILGYFVTDKLAKRLGYDSVGDLVADIRPPAPFVEERKVA